MLYINTYNINKDNTGYHLSISVIMRQHCPKYLLSYDVIDDAH